MDDSYVNPEDRDPDFPDRPVHPDFVLMSNVIQGMDMRAGAETDIIGEILQIDGESFLYATSMRLKALSQAVGVDLDNSLVSAIYLDAFTAGKLFAEARQREVRQ